MGIKNKIAQYHEWKSGVKHCTFNPDGPSVVRMHLIPPKFNIFKNAPYILILNGYYLLPVGYSWAVMLAAFMEEVNKFDGREISDEDVAGIEERTIRRTKAVYTHTSEELLREDLAEMLDIIFDVAHGGKTEAYIEKLSVRAYRNRMSAPHRMDLMVSAMTDENGAWKCNQKCIFCYAAGQEYAKTRELSTQEWKKAIDTLRDAGVPMVTFTGGEPTQRTDLVELVAHFGRGCDCAFVVLYDEKRDGRKPSGDEYRQEQSAGAKQSQGSFLGRCGRGRRKGRIARNRRILESA
jgi:hypothetical protein